MFRYPSLFFTFLLPFICAFLLARPLPGQQVLDLLPQRPALAEQWLQSISELLQPNSARSADPAGNSGSLREASSQEAALFQAIEKLAAYYGFAFKRYNLDQIQTMHSFSSNLEILLPAPMQNDAATVLLQQRGLGAELWNQIYQSKREIVLLTSISGESILDIVTLLLFMAISLERAPVLPVRLVFLGSELVPTEFHWGKQLYPEIVPEDDFRNYPIGSRSFLYDYQLSKPYGLLYLYRLPQALSQNSLWESLQRAIRELSKLWEPDTGSVSSLTGNPPIQIIYHGSQHQTPVRDTLQLSQALQHAEIPFYFNNGFKILQSLSFGQKYQLLDPYIEKQWPIVALHQAVGESSPAQWVAQAKQLTTGLRQFLSIKLEQAIQEQSQSSAPPPDGRHYWLMQTPKSPHISYISERQILLLLLLAFVLFALSSFRAHSQFRQLQLIHGMKIHSTIITIVTVVVLIASYTMFANEGLLFVLGLFSRLFPVLESDLSIEGLFAAIFLNINFALLFLYGAAFGLHLEKRLEIRVLPYISQCLAFATLLLLLWQDFSLAILGLYLFFLHSLYNLLSKYRIRLCLLRLLQRFLQYSVIFLLFLPYFFLLLAYSPASLYELLSHRRLYILTLLLFLPNLFLYFTQSQFCRLYYPSRYYGYLLRRIIFYIASIFVCVAVLYFWGWKSLRHSGPSAKFHLQELYVLNSQETGHKVLELHRDSGPLYQIEVFDFRGDRIIHLDPMGRFQRSLHPEEVQALKSLGQELFSHNGTEVRQHYFSILQLQTAVPLRYITAEIKASQLLFANFPFSISLNNPVSSHRLIMGSNPPSGLRIELLLAGKPEQFLWDIGLQVPNMQAGEDPMVHYLFPVLSQVGPGPYTVEHTVQVRGLRVIVPESS